MLIRKPMIMVFNKIDDFSYEKKDEDDLTLQPAKIFLWKNGKNMDGQIKYPTVFISALTKENFPEMKKMIYDEVMKIHISRFHTTISFSNILITKRKKTTINEIYFFLLFIMFSVFGFSQKSKVDLKLLKRASKDLILLTIMINFFQIQRISEIFRQYRSTVSLLWRTLEKIE
jgi:hypothetical protein